MPHACHMYVPTVILCFPLKLESECTKIVCHMSPVTCLSHAYHMHVTCLSHDLLCDSIAVSAKFVFGNDLAVVHRPEEYREFIEAIGKLVEMFVLVTDEPPLYKLYNNWLARHFSEAMKVVVTFFSLFMERPLQMMTNYAPPGID